MPRRGLKRRTLDELFPTVARYVGLLLIPVAVIDRGNNPGLYPLIVGLLAMPNVAGAGKGDR